MLPRISERPTESAGGGVDSVVLFVAQAFEADCPSSRSLHCCKQQLAAAERPLSLSCGWWLPFCF